MDRDRRLECDAVTAHRKSSYYESIFHLFYQSLVFTSNQYPRRQVLQRRQRRATPRAATAVRLVHPATTRHSANRCVGHIDSVTQQAMRMQHF